MADLPKTDEVTKPSEEATAVRTSRKRAGMSDSIAALGKIDAIMSELDWPDRARILAWLQSSYGLPVVEPGPGDYVAGDPTATG